MDPVTTVQLVDAAISLLKVCRAVVRTVQELRRADESLLEVSHELEAFKEFLEGLKRVLENQGTSHRISTEVLDNVLKESRFTMNNLAKRLNRIRNVQSITKRRMLFLNAQTDIGQLRNRLRHHSLRLNNILTLVHTETFLRALNRDPQVLQLCSQAQEQLEGRGDLIMGIPVEDSDVHLVASIEPSSNIYEAQEIEDIATRKKVKHGPEVLKGPGLRRKSCSFDCYCDCHSDEGRVSAKLVVKLKSATINVASRNKRPCSNEDCLRSKTSLTDKKKLILPSSNFKKAMTGMLLVRGTTRKYHLRTYRIVPQNWDTARYANRGDLKNLRACIESGEGTPYDTQADGWSLLHLAAYLGHLSVVVYLLSIGADVEVGEIGTRKPVDLAILRAMAIDATETHKQIMKAFPNVDDYLADFSFTPIHCAVLGLYEPQDRARPTLKQLLDLVDEANNAPAGTDWTAWKREQARRSEIDAKIMASPLAIQIVEMFRTAAERLPPTEKKPVLDIINQADEKWGWPPFHWAAFTGRLDKMRELSNNNADPFLDSPMKRNVVHIACESKRPEVLSYVLDIWRQNKDQLDINKHDRWKETPLHVAASYSEACVKLLLKEGVNLNARQENEQVPMHYTCVCSDQDERFRIISLLAHQPGILINAQDEQGRTPVFELLGSPACVRELAECGADFSISDNSGDTIIHNACVEDEGKALEDILELSPDPNAATRLNRKGNTPLIEACAHKSSACAMILLAKANVESTLAGKDGWTAVHHAAQWGDANILEALLTHSSFERGKKTNDKKTAEIISKEACTFSGRVKDLLRRYDSVAGIDIVNSQDRRLFYEAAAHHLVMK